MLALMFLPEVVDAQNIYARKGFLDLRQWDFEQSHIPLNGEWEFYMSELIAPNDFSNKVKSPQDYIDFPATWNELSRGRRPGDGYATYHLKVLVKTPALLALELPHFYSNYSLWINAELIASNGQVGTTEKTSKPQWRPQTVSFNATSDTLDIVIQASNFHHAKGGVREPLLLGDAKKLEFKRRVATISNLTEFGGLIITATFFVLLFLFSRRERSLLYFIGLCLTWAVRSLFSNRYVAISFFPDFPWEICVKIEYITLYLMMIMAILFIASVFRNEVNSASKYLFCLFNGIFILLTLFFTASLYTQFLPVYLSFAAVLLVYIVYILIRALVYEREGVWFMISCLFLGVIMFSYDIVSYQGFATFNPVILSVGYFIMYMLMGICLLFQLGYLKRPTGHVSVLTYEDLYGESKKEKR